jgi:hypothetical protein
MLSSIKDGAGWSIAIAKHAGEPFEDESEKWALREIGGCISGMNGDDSGL